MPDQATQPGTAIVNAALWLREQVAQCGVAQMSLTFLEEPVNVTYTLGRGAMVAVAGAEPVELRDEDLDGERWTACVDAETNERGPDA